jgi:hypothetical protein
MSQQFSETHPQVVLRSRYTQVRALLALAAITVVSLAVAVVILAVNDDDGADLARITTAPVVTAPVSTDTATVTPGLRYDGGPDEGSRGPHAVAPPMDTRFDGGPDEGTRGPRPEPMPAGTRSDGGPEEGTRGAGH